MFGDFGTPSLKSLLNVRQKSICTSGGLRLDFVDVDLARQPRDLGQSVNFVQLIFGLHLWALHKDVRLRPVSVAKQCRMCFQLPTLG